MIRYLYYVTIGLVAVLLTGVQAQAAHCGDRLRIVQRLAVIYGENRQVVDAGPAGLLIEVFSARHSGSWTIIATPPGGPTCLLAAGQAFNWREPLLAVLKPAV